MNKESLRPVLPEFENVTFPVNKSRVVAPCREVTLDRRLCRTLQVDTVAKCPLETGELLQKRTLVPKKRLERKWTRFSVWEEDIRQEVASYVTTESETEVVPRRQDTLTDRVALRRRLRADRTSNEAATSGMSLVENRTLPNYAASLVKFVNWVEHRERGVETDTEIDAAMSTWMKSEFKRNPGELGRAVGQCLGKQEPFTRKTRYPRGAEYLGKSPGLAAPRTWTPEEALATNSMIGDCVPAKILPGASASWGPAEVPRIIKPVEVLHLSDPVPVLSQGDHGVNAATGSTMQRYQRHYHVCKIANPYKKKPDNIFCDATNNSWPCGATTCTWIIWDLVASTERPFCGTHRLRHSTNE